MLRYGSRPCQWRRGWWGKAAPARLLHGFKRLVEVVDEVLVMLRSDAQADGSVVDALLRGLLLREFRVGGALWMHHQRLHIGHVGQVGEDLQVVDEVPRLLLVAIDLKGEDGPGAV